MKSRHSMGNVFRKVLSFALALAITVSFSQPLSAEAKAKVNKVILDKQGFTIENDVIKNVAKPLKNGKNNVVIWYRVGTVYDGYSKFTAPKTKTYTFEFSNLKGDKKAGRILGDVSGYYPSGQIMRDAKIGPKKNMYHVQLGSSNLSVYKKTFTSKVTLKKGQTIYFYNKFMTHYKDKSVENISLDVKIK